MIKILINQNNEIQEKNFVLLIITQLIVTVINNSN